MIGMKQIQCAFLAMALAATMASPVSVSAAKSTKKTEATTTAAKKKSKKATTTAKKKSDKKSDKTEETTTEATTTEATTADNRVKERVTYTMSNIDITGQSALVIDVKTGEVLYRKNETKKQYPSSIAKLMTAIIAYENMELSDVVRYTKQVVNAVPEGDLTAGIKKNERLTVKQSMNLLLLYSANDAATGLAYECSGNMDSFAELMNEKASELGCENTHFENSTGDYVKEQYTTASDMALIAKEAYGIKTIRSILKTKKYTINATNKHKKKQTWKNSNRMLNKKTDFYYANCIGGRTGVYEGSGKKGDTDFSTIVSYAKLQGRPVCAVILNDTNVEACYTDAINLFNYIDEHADLSVYKTSAKATTTAKSTTSSSKTTTKKSGTTAKKKATTAAKKTTSFTSSRAFLIVKIAGVVILVLIVLALIRIISVNRSRNSRRRRAEKERKARLKRQRKRNRRRR